MDISVNKLRHARKESRLNVFISVIAICLLLAGCGDNPLLGTWKAKPGQKNAFIVCKEMIFKKDISQCAGMIEEVTYDVRDDLVIVSSELGDKIGIKAAYKIVDENTMIMDVPMGGKIIYGRYSY